MGRAPFAWSDREWRRPPYADLYHLRTSRRYLQFDAELSGRDRSPRVSVDLGVNCIELLPSYEFTGSIGWGYNPSYFFTVEKAYGTPEEMKRLVDEAHRKGIAVIMDVVLAHTGHKLSVYQNVFLRRTVPGTDRGIGEENQFGFPMLDHTKPATQALVKRYSALLARRVPYRRLPLRLPARYRHAAERGVPFLVNTARAVREDAYLIGEYSPEAPDLVNSVGFKRRVARRREFL